MAFGAVAGAGGAFGQRLWDDPAFVLYREAVEAMDFVLAHFLLGQATLAQGRWSEAAAAFRTVVDLYPGSLAGRRALQPATERGESAAETAAVESGAS